MADLEIKVQIREEEKIKQNYGELLFTSMLISIPLQNHKYIVNVSILRHTDLMVLALQMAKMKVTDLKTKCRDWRKYTQNSTTVNCYLLLYCMQYQCNFVSK